MVAKDFNHPSVIFYSIGNEIPETGNADRLDLGTQARREGALPRPHPLRHQRHQRVRRDARHDRAADEGAPRGRRRCRRRGRRVNTMMAGFGQMMSHIQSSDAATERTEESFAVLDVAGMNYADARYEPDRELLPRPHHRRHRDLADARSSATGSSCKPTPRHRRLHLDRLGLPRRDRHRRDPIRRHDGHGHRLLRRIPGADRLVRRHRHRRPPPPRLLLPGDRLRPALRAVHRGQPAREPRPPDRGRDAVGVGRRHRELDLAGLGGHAGHGRRLQRRRRGGTARQRPFTGPQGGRRQPPVPRGVRDRLPAGRTARHRLHRRRRDRAVPVGDRGRDTRDFTWRQISR